MEKRRMVKLLLSLLNGLNKLNSVVPGANPGRVVESKGENITAIDFETN